MASLPYLPSEIWFDEILTRIKSLESLGKCRVVSKDWNHITYESRFWKLFCKRGGTVVSGLLIQSLLRNNYSSTFVSVDNKDNKTSSQSILNFLPVPVKIEAVSNQGGLVFCVSRNHSKKVPEYIVCKPTTLQWKKIPNPKTRYFTERFSMVVMSSKPLRYKIIRFSQPKSLIFEYLRCEVFDSRTWAWKQMKDVSLPFSVFLGNRPYITSHGACYWLLTNNQVFAFHYEDDKESWEIFDLPHPVSDSDCYNSNKLVEYQGHLALVCCDQSEYLNLWVMEDHDRKVWSKHTLVINIKVRKELDGCTNPTDPTALYNSDIALMEEYNKVILYKFQDSSCNVVTLDQDRPGETFKLQSDFEKVNLRGP